MATLLLVLSLLSLSVAEAQRGGFSVELIHRDSPRSPFYNADETPSQRLTKAMQRSFARVHTFGLNAASPEGPQAEIIPNYGEYLMNISIGTPPVTIMGIADTGSDLLWTQCKPCSRCYKQDAPLFDPSASSTYKDLSCDSRPCETVQGSCSEEVCHYSVNYGDKSFSHGNLAVDALTLASTTGRPVTIPNTIIGCGHDNDGTFDSKGSGIVGLGGGPVSLVQQMGSLTGGKFSYCLVPLTNEAGASSKINFGTNAVVSGSGAVSTPLVKDDPSTFYFLTLEAISVGTKRIKFNGSRFGTTEGNIVIDSGTTLTLLPQDFYAVLESAVSSQIDANPIKSPDESLGLCYNKSPDFKVPTITVHFKDADVNLKPVNTFVEASMGVLCFTFVPAYDVAIYGNLAQMNFLVGYDSTGQTVSFKPTDCAKM